MNEPLMLPTSSVTLVFGLEWFALVGAKIDKSGMRVARQYRATHMVLNDSGVGAVGVVALKRSRSARKDPLHSAARNVALLYPTGTFAMVLQLQIQAWWVVAVHEGEVIVHTDRICHSEPDAKHVITELRSAYPQILELGDLSAPSLLTLAAIGQASSAHSRLQRIGRWRSMLPWPVQGFIFALVLVLLVPRLLEIGLPGARSPSEPNSTDSVAFWKQAINHSAVNHRIHGVQGTRRLLDSLYQLPTLAGGWSLIQVECSALVDQWQCQAHYERGSDIASNRSLLTAAPSEWKIDFPTMDKAIAAWHASAAATPLLHHKLGTSPDNTRDLFSRLQGIKSGFAQIQFGRAIALPVAQPKDSHGTVMEKPAGLPVYLSRSIQITGPLRSANVLLPYVGAMAWHKAALSVRHTDKPNLTNSRLIFSLQGVLYETDIHSSSNTETRSAVVPAS